MLCWISSSLEVRQHSMSVSLLPNIACLQHPWASLFLIILSLHRKKMKIVVVQFLASSGIPVYVSGKFPHSVIGKGQVKSSTDRLYPGNNDMPTFMDHRSDVKTLKT